MQKHSFYLCRYLARNGVHVDLYHTGKQKKDIDLASCFTAEELPYIHSHLMEWPPADKFPGHYVRTSHKYSEKLFRLFQQHNTRTPVDLVYAKGLAGWYLLQQKAAGVALPPVFLNVHGYEYYQKAASLRMKIEHQLLRPPFLYVNQQADHIFSYGGRVSEIIRKHTGQPAAKIIEIPTGIEPEFLNEQLLTVQQPRQFVFVGRYERRKGIIELNKAILQLLKQNAPFRFHFIGNLPEKDRIQSPAITYYGVVNDKQLIKDVLQQADVLVCPSYAEGMPNVILEGMAAGCAVIASDVGAVNAQVSNANGWLVEPGSVTALQAALQTVIDLDDVSLLARKKASVQRIKDDFLWDRIILRVIDAFETVLKKTYVAE
ncbi:MAG: glycosyltransferase family 4 protein [Candidatus Pseudobacter hemicellulosilyticus]|uniref:Glycosyltransferase family 4 protein n=1 Tax=Candidatus Pseudobacter hemicellulosilyticus TaxID=3121375 RepID=A0AAJ6BI53_9BACT|nr:MAG: glycosyltransferase family 4 protein [Pseudobacter sp.]